MLGPRVRVLRREDFLALELELVNLRLDGPTLVRETAGEPAYLVVHFPTQHTLEEAFQQDASGGPPPGPVPVRALRAGPTRLVFKLPDDQDGFDYSLDTLLDWKRYAPVLAPNALPPDATTGPGPAEPAAGQTAIEFPTSLVLSPDASASWAHAVQPVTRNDRTELWHTRLGLRRTSDDGAIDVDDSAAAALRAVWSYTQGNRFRASLGDLTRQQIVRLTSDFTLIARPPLPQGFNPAFRHYWRRQLQAMGIPLTYVPRPITARRFMLTSLGAWASLQSAWDYPTIIDANTSQFTGYPILSLEQWQHRATLGRDHFVRTVRKGFLCPTGNRASLVTVTERQFQPYQIRTEQTPQGRVGIFGAIAYLRQYHFIIVQEPDKDYAALGPAFEHAGREMPLRHLRILTRETPKLDNLPAEGTVAAQRAFWPVVGGQPFRFQMIGQDWDGESVNFDLPLMFVPLEAVGDPAARVTEYNAALEARRETFTAGQAIAYAPTLPEKPGATTLETRRVVFQAQLVTAARAAALRPASPHWLPRVASADISIPAVDQLLGSSEGVSIRLDATYLSHGLAGAANQGEVFASLLTPLQVPFAAQKAGGLLKPDLGVEGLSRTIGPVSKLAAAKNATIDTSAFDKFRLLGGITVKDVVDAAGGFNPADLTQADLPPDELLALMDNPSARIKVPILTSRPVYPPGVAPSDPLAKPSAVETRFLWKPEIKAPPLAGIFQLVTDAGFPNRATLAIYARMLAALDGGSSSFLVKGTLREFGLSFAKIMLIRFQSLSFTAEEGKKVDVSAEGVELQFQGALKFVETLKNILPADGFSDPPFVSVQADGVTAGYTLGIPSVGVGIFSIQNIALSAALSLPFVDKPAGVRFAISERHNPFLVTVTLFGGGGFFALALNARGIEQIEAAIEFGGNLSLNLGVASGGVYVMAGIYFRMTTNDLVLSGYLRCGGYLSVLGIISISIEFYLSLTYRAKGSKGEVWGQASVTVCVKVLCFSTRLSLSVERRFAGAAGDPTFADVVSPADWDEYCAAFA